MSGPDEFTEALGAPDDGSAALFATPIRTPDWRVWLGLAITFLWILLGLAYVAGSGGVLPFFSQPADVLGSFLEGAFAPLAFLWLVIGYFLQQRELSQNTRALHLQFQEVRRQAEQATIQARAIAANELHARQDTFLRIAEQVDYQLGTIAGFLYLSSQSTGAGGAVPPEEIADLFRQLSRGDSHVFSMRLLDLAVSLDDDEVQELFYGSPVRARHSNNFIGTFRRLVARADECDPEGMIGNALRTNAHGLLDQWMERAQALAPPELADPERTGTHLDITGGPAPPRPRTQPK
jgi:hypothetical protein